MYPGRVRIADPRDEDEIMALCLQLHEENGLFPVNKDKVRAMMRRAFNRDSGVLGTIGESGKIEAMIFMLVSTFWYSDKHHLEELFSYVHPDYRKSKNAVDLIGFAKWCSDQSGFPLVIGVISNDRTEEKVRLYQRQLDKPMGNFFLYLAKDTKEKVA